MFYCARSWRPLPCSVFSRQSWHVKHLTGLGEHPKLPEKYTSSVHESMSKFNLNKAGNDSDNCPRRWQRCGGRLINVYSTTLCHSDLHGKNKDGAGQDHAHLNKSSGILRVGSEERSQGREILDGEGRKLRNSRQMLVDVTINLGVRADRTLIGEGRRESDHTERQRGVASYGSQFIELVRGTGHALGGIGERVLIRRQSTGRIETVSSLSGGERYKVSSQVISTTSCWGSRI